MPLYLSAGQVQVAESMPQFLQALKELTECEPAGVPSTYDGEPYINPFGSVARVVVRGVALFPLGETASADYASHPLYRSLDKLGVGALPFLPHNHTWVGTWLRSVMEAPNKALAWPGPPFSAWESLPLTPSPRRHGIDGWRETPPN